MTSSYLAEPLRSEAEVRARKEILAVAVAWRTIIWRQAAKDEDERIDRLIDVCVRLCDGNMAAGKDLATRAIWCPG